MFEIDSYAYGFYLFQIWMKTFLSVSLIVICRHVYAFFLLYFM
jgi:hypothetical protein